MLSQFIQILLVCLVIVLGILYILSLLKLRKCNPYLAELLSISNSGEVNVENIYQNSLKSLSRITSAKYVFFYTLKNNEYSLSAKSHNNKKTETFISEIETTGLLNSLKSLKSSKVFNEHPFLGNQNTDFITQYPEFSKIAVIPVIGNNEIQGILIITGKKTNYSKTDISQGELLAKAFWQILSLIKTDELLTQSERHYRFISENTSDVIWILDPYLLRFTYISPSIINFRGYTPEEIYNQTFKESVTEKSYNYIVQTLPIRIQKYHNGNKKMLQNISEIEQVCKNGEIITTEVSSKLLVDESNRVIGVLGVSRDITQRKDYEDKFRKNEMVYRLVFNNVPVGIFYFDGNGIINDMNDEFVNLIGSNRDILTKISLFDLPDKKIVSAIKKALQGIQTSLELDYHAVTSGRVIPIRASFSPVMDNFNSIAGGVGIIEDISDRRQLERIFFHDILNTAGNLWNLSLILAEKDIEEDVKESIVNKIKEVSGLLIKEIKIQRTLLAEQSKDVKPELEIVEINSFVKNVIESYVEPLNYQSKKLLYQSSVKSLDAETDKVLLARVIRNMVKNAIEAENEGGQIVISLNVDGKNFIISVSNSAIIPKVVQDRIFTKRISTKSSDRGMGTFSMKLITEQYLKGKISFISNNEVGTVFTVQYPLRSN